MIEIDRLEIVREIEKKRRERERERERENERKRGGERKKNIFCYKPIRFFSTGAKQVHAKIKKNNIEMLPTHQKKKKTFWLRAECGQLWTVATAEPNYSQFKPRRTISNNMLARHYCVAR